MRRALPTAIAAGAEPGRGADQLLSLENLESVIGSTTATAIKPDSDPYPDIIGHAHFDVGSAKLGVEYPYIRRARPRTNDSGSLNQVPLSAKYSF